MSTPGQPRTSLELLAEHEARPVTRDREDIAKRAQASAMGRELNRLQGYVGSAVSERVQLLNVRGQVTKQELKSLLLSLAHERLLEIKSPGGM